MVSLSSGLLQFVSNAYFDTPNTNGTSASIDQNHMQLLSFVNQQRASSSATTASSTTASAQLAQDTYTPSAQTQATQSSGASSSASGNLSQAQASQGDTFTLASLIKNQTISGSLEMRRALIPAMDHFADASDLASQAFGTLAVKVEAQDYSGAQTALADYTTALAKAIPIMSMSPFTTPTPRFMNDLTVLGSALQSGTKADVQAAFMAASNDAPDNVLGAESITFESGDMTGYAGVLQEAVANMAVMLQQIGYTAANATTEANAMMLGMVADGTTGHTISDQPQVDQWITDLAKAVTRPNSAGQGASTDSALMSSILASMLDKLNKDSVTVMETTLNQLDGKYGSGAQGTGANSACQASVSVYA